jgi:hypothetical protein
MFDKPIARCTARCRKILDLGIEVLAAARRRLGRPDNIML